MKNNILRFLIILLLILVSASAFIAGGLAYKYGLHHRLPCARYLISLMRKDAKEAEPEFFYPAPKQDISEIFQKKDIEYPFTFIVYGDSREPASYEKHAIIAKIIREQPSFVIHLGDMVRYGEEHQWKMFDLFEGKIIDSGIPFYPVLGNHEYHTIKERYPFNPKDQLKHYFNRFTFLENRRWYSFKYGNSLFLILDTNTDCSPESYQYKWLINKLKGEIPDFLFIMFHHPSYTKCIHKSDRESEKHLADILGNYKDQGLIKNTIAFSAHVHNYERYKHRNIHYIVSGGGGAPQHSVKRNANDFYTQAGENFHYCKIIVSETELTFEMVKLDKDTGKWVVADTFNSLSAREVLKEFEK